MRRFVRSNSLSLVTFGLAAAFIIGLSVTGARVHDSDQREHGQPAEGYAAYLKSGDFIEAVFGNWESEFLSIGMLLVLSIRLRNRGSPESKPVHALHAATGS